MLKFFKHKEKINEKEKEISLAIKNLREQIDQTYALFNLTDDENLIEAYIHEINSLNARYDYLIKEFKKEKSTVNT